MFRVVLLLLATKTRSIRGSVASMWEVNRLKLLAGLITVGLIAPGMYFLFRFLFERLLALDDTGFGLALSSRLLTSAFMAFSVFLAVSSLISGISILYRSRETSLLMSLPVPSSAVAVFRTAESWYHAGWSTMLIGVPVILAFASVTRSRSAAFAGTALLLPLVTASVAFGSIVLAALSRLGSMKGLKRGASGVAIAAALLIIGYFQGMKPDSIVIPDSSAGDLQAVHRFVAGLPGTGLAPWPHALFGSVVGGIGSNGFDARSSRAALILTGEALLLSTAALLLTARGFRARHAAMCGDSGRALSAGFVFRSGGPRRALFEKDILLFSRDPVQWSQLALLAGMFLMYAGNLDQFDMDYAQRIWLGVAVFMNISFSGFVMATLLVRFSFPSMSIEGPGLPFLLQIPGARSIMLSSKWLTSMAFVLPLMLGAGMLSSARMGAGGVFLLETLAAIVLMALALSSINTALGAIYPSFSDNSPASIASGQGGIVAAFASMGYVLAMVTTISFATRAYLAEGFHEAAMVASLGRVALFIVPLTALVTVGSMRGALASFRRRDF